MERGIKLFLPGPADGEVSAFLDVLGMARGLGYDFVMLELGGAMQYLRHPEINAGWLEYSAFMNEYPGKTQAIQRGQRWEKNSIHTDNGHGKVIDRATLGRIVAFCAKCGLEIVPEVPTLSHSDYLMFGHPELSERPEDPYPDSACPLHPAYFPLVFDIMDEVIEVFEPRRINIGHDEAYTLCKCQRCKSHSAPELYAWETNRVAEYLRGKGIKTMMWAEKLLDSHFQNGIPIGGAQIPESPQYEARDALYPCGELIDKDVQMLHWYWSIDRNFDHRYQELGVDYWFGNFEAEKMPQLRERLAAPHCRGFVVSNWGATDLDTMQRNGILYSIFYAAMVTDGKHDADGFDALDKQVRQRIHELFRPQGDVIEISHTTHTTQKHHFFYDGCYLQQDFYRMGDHILADDDGNTYRLPVIFGTNISNDDVQAGRTIDNGGYIDAYYLDMQLIEVTGRAMPFCADDGRMFYRAVYSNPAPGKRLHYLRFEAASTFVPEVEVLGGPKAALRTFSSEQIFGQ